MLSLLVAPISGERLNTIVKKEFVLPLHDEKLNNLFEIGSEDIIPGEILVKFKDGKEVAINVNISVHRGCWKNAIWDIMD
jgi:hypothetical protein